MNVKIVGDGFLFVLLILLSYSLLPSCSDSLFYHFLIRKSISATNVSVCKLCYTLLISIFNVFMSPSLLFPHERVYRILIELRHKNI